ncbi:MAG: D-alanyl-D-alanine carboxypeptidase [Ruminococcaceae bacterium]|nr:D-alanyl-D-alanine carboxypeptidase [Oscillospiraceae bacterium]
MKNKILACALMIVLLFSFSVVYAQPEGESNNSGQLNTESAEEVITAMSPHALLVDMNTGIVIYSKNSTEKVYPSALTNIMTALLVLENCNLEEFVTASESALSNVPSGDNKLGIVKDENLSVRQLLYAMLLASSSDATNLLAEKTSGSIDEFVKLMNIRAKELGMVNTNFTNPTGAHDERHYTTAEDMAILVRVAMENETFREIVKSQSYSIPATEQNPTARKVINKNHLVSILLRNDYFYEHATGIKTGYSPEAKSCVAASAERRGISLLALVFEADTVDNVAQSFADCKAMFDFVFNNYVSQSIVSEGDIIAQTGVSNTRRDNKLILKSGKELSVIRYKNSPEAQITFKDNVKKTVSAPVKSGQVIGTREYFADGVSIGTVDLLADKSYKLDLITFLMNRIIAFVTSPWLFVTLAAIVFVFVMLERRRRRILRKKRRDARKKRNRELIRRMDDFE